MSPDPAYRQRGRIVFGLFIIAVGTFALLDNLDLFDSRLVQPYWPLVFVALGAMRLGSPERTGRLLGSLVLIGVGAGLTLHNLGWIHFNLRDWWPLMLILAGLCVIAQGFGPPRQRRRREPPPAGLDFPGPAPAQEHGSRIDASAILSGLVLKNDSQEFQGGEISTIMGSVELDLRQASIVGEAHLHLSIIMGGVEIRVPRDWSISVQGSPTLGGIEDRTVPPMAATRRLVIHGSVVMGGVEIDN